MIEMRAGALAKAAVAGMAIGALTMLGSVLPDSASVAKAAEQEQAKANVTMNWVSSDTKTVAGEPLAYLSTPNPVIASNLLTIQPGTVTEWMTHPVPAYIYVLEGTLTVEFAGDGSRHEFKAGQAFLQARDHWHRGRNDGTVPVRFLGVFMGAKDVPDILHPPGGKLVQ
jgi:quercetin dioxygenase-like cupin family protein